MPKHNSNICDEATTLRRSPRLLHHRKPPDMAKISKSMTRKNRVCRSPISSNENTQLGFSPSSVEHVFLNEPHVDYSKSVNGSRESARSLNGAVVSRGLRRSPRFSNAVKTLNSNTVERETFESVLLNEEVSLDMTQEAYLGLVRKCSPTNNHEHDIQKKGHSMYRGLRRSPRFSNCGKSLDTNLGEKESVQIVRLNEEVSSDLSLNGNLGKKRRRFHTKSHGRGVQKKVHDQSNQLVDRNCSGKRVFSKLIQNADAAERQTWSLGATDGIDKAEVKVGSERQCTRKMNEGCRGSSYVSPLVVKQKKGKEKNTGDVGEGNDKSGVKRERKQGKESCGLVGWTMEQEVALQRAYFAAKPSPHFWKKVSKLVPGKSAQECFDKVHSDLVTPPQPRTHSRAKKISSSTTSDLSLSASKLLDPLELNIKKSNFRKQKRHLAQRTARDLVRRHYLVAQDYEADLFSVFEPTTNPPTQDLQKTEMPSTPKNLMKKPVILKRCRNKSSSGHKKSCSRFGNSSQTALISPLVLKQVKNMALHEKYIDQLHCREARRRTAVLGQVAKHSTDKEDDNLQKVDMIKAAKNALLSDARYVINQFQDLQANVITDSDDFDDDGECGEGEGGP